MLETAKALAGLSQQFPEQVDVVVWLNEYFGPIRTASGSVAKNHERANITNVWFGFQA
jgi:hypothetical protein